MKYEDVVACIGENEAVERAPAAQHKQEVIDKYDWLAYVAEPLRRSWSLLQQFREDECPEILDRLSFADWEEFCYRHTSARPCAFYSEWLCKADGL